MSQLAPLSFTIPQVELAEFAALPQNVRDEIRRVLALLATMNQRGGVAAARAVALGGRGMSAGSLKRKWYAFKNCGWRGLIDRAKTAKGDALPPEFVEYWRALIAGNDRALTMKTAYARFMQAFRSGASIEGLGTWQEWHARTVRGSLPTSCPWDVLTCPPLLSYRNLTRIPRNTAEMEGARKGAGAARFHLAKLQTDLSQLRLLECVMFDDFRTDFKVIDWASGQVCELWGLAALDVSTRKVISFCLRPRIERADGSHVGIARRDMLHLVGRLLKQYGFPRDYAAHWVMENASATVSDALADVLGMISGGNIQVHKTQMFRQKALLGGWFDTVGNPNGKGPLEAFWRLSWNHLGWEPGQTGSKYELRPATLAGRESEASKLIRAGASLPLELKRQLLEGYFHSTEEAAAVIHSCWERLADRLDHKLEGFETVREWRWNGQAEWRNVDIDPLPNLGAEAFKQAVQLRPRLETCNERARRLLVRDGANFERAGDAALALIFCDSRPLTYNGSGVFMVESKGRASRMFKSDHLPLVEGQKYTVVHDGEDFQELYILTPRGEFVGVAHHVQRVGYLDKAGVAKMIEEKEARVKETLARVKGRQSTAEVENRLAVLDTQAAILGDLAGLPTAPTAGKRLKGVEAFTNARDAAREARKVDTKAALGKLLSSGLGKEAQAEISTLDF